MREVQDRVAGVDEAGRGPWAGPVVAAAVILPPGAERRGALPGLADSKRLRRARREAIYRLIAGTAVVGVGAASAREIERLNVLGATLLAMRRAVARLAVRPRLVLIDGPVAPPLDLPVRAVIGGDGIEPAIAAASIVAKVTRDRLMARLARRFPGFGWERNFGYGTPEHQAALARLGPTAHHRRSFAPVRACLPGPV